MRQIEDGSFLMLALRLIAPNDYIVLEDRQPIGRIRLARERTPPIWLWTVTVTIPGPPFGTPRHASRQRGWRSRTRSEPRHWRRLMLRWSTPTGPSGIGGDVTELPRRRGIVDARK
jgi:hypothetical protein